MPLTWTRGLYGLILRAFAQFCKASLGLRVWTAAVRMVGRIFRGQARMETRREQEA